MQYAWWGQVTFVKALKFAQKLQGSKNLNIILYWIGYKVGYSEAKSNVQSLFRDLCGSSWQSPKDSISNLEDTTLYSILCIGKGLLHCVFWTLFLRPTFLKYHGLPFLCLLGMFRDLRATVFVFLIKFGLVNPLVPSSR